MKKTRIFKLIDPSEKRWDIYESLIPLLDKSYGLHADASVKVHIKRRKINRFSNTLTIDFYADREEDFYKIDYDAIVIYTKAGLAFEMMSTVSESEVTEHQVSNTYQLLKGYQSSLNWDRWMRVLKVFDTMCGEYGVRTERIFYPQKWAVHYDCYFTSWEEFSMYSWEIGRIVEKYQLSIESIQDLAVSNYQLDLFEDIIDLTDSKRIRDYA